MATAPARDYGVEIWKPAQGLSDRVKKLRDQYFSFRERPFKNEVMAFSTGRQDDVLFSPHQWGVAPEVFIFSKSFQDILGAIAKTVELPEGFRQKSLAVRRAVFFAEVIKKHLPVTILEGELIAGGQFNTALSRVFTEQETEEWSALEKKWFRKNLWMNVTGIGNCGAVPGHLIPDYPSVLRLGFSGLVKNFRALQKNASRRHADFLDSLIIACEAVPRFTGRYADLALALAQSERDAGRAEELKEMSRICRKVPWEPAETFYEALQSLWFMHMLVMAAESYPGPGLSPGRVDQYLYPYYRADLDQGRMSRGQARELLRCWFIKPNYAYDFMGRVGTNQGINSGFGQLITIGGCGPHGEDVSNDLTMLILDVIGEMNMLEPKPNVRVHAGMREEVMERVVDLVADAQGSPFLLNFDEIAIKALRWSGLPEEDLWDYAPVGCLENTLQGNDRSGTVDVNLNMAKAVELMLSNGRDMRLKKRIGPRTGNPARFASFERVKDAYLSQLAAQVDYLIERASEADAIRARFEPTPYLSAIVRGCAESGKDVSAGGPEHNYITIEGVALATAVDSLAAIKKLVFDEGRVSMADLVKAVRKNFKGNEALRQMLVTRGPKYGNGDPAADAIARDINHFFSNYAMTRTSPATGRRFRSGFLSWNYWILYATSTAATPDGRMRGTYLSNGVCPVTGADRKGPVAVARSVFNADLGVVPNGGSHTISFNPSIARTRKGRKNIEAFLRGYGIQGGSALQINMIDPGTLRAAQKNPEQYSNLLVRVTGYNAYFTTLGKEIQDEIISRESFRLGEES